MRRPVRLLGAALALGTLLALAGCGGAAPSPDVVRISDVRDGDQMNGAVLTEPYRLGDATLTATDGSDFVPSERLDHPLTLVFFGYTSCPDICQAVMADLTSALNRLDPAQAAQVSMWFVTTDPARDDPEVLRSYLDRFDPSFEGLTGPLVRIKQVAASVHILIEKGRRLPSGGYEVSHGTPILAVLPDSSVPMLWTEGTSSAKIAEDVSALLSGALDTSSTQEQ